VVRRAEKKWPTLHEMVWSYIDDVLDHCDGNITQTAEVLGMHRSALQRKLRKRRGDVR